MSKMHQTKLATIIIIKCAFMLGEGKGWQTSWIIMKPSMCTAVLQQLCLAQQAGNDACYKNPQSPTRPPTPHIHPGVCSPGGCARCKVPSCFLREVPFLKRASTQGGSIAGLQDLNAFTDPKECPSFRVFSKQQIIARWQRLA